MSLKTKSGTKLNEWRVRSRNEDLPCNKCGRVGLMTLDHIVPLGFLEILGIAKNTYDDDWNFQWLCRACNVLKAYRLDWNNPNTIINLRRYLDIAEKHYSIEKLIH